MEKQINQWKKYDPEWLIKAAEYHFEEIPWIRGALLKCTTAKERNNLYTYFVDAKKPNENGSLWKFQESIVVKDSLHGEIVVDIIKPNRVGGIEFLTRVLNENNS